MLAPLAAIWLAALALALAWVGRSLLAPAGVRLAVVLPAVAAATAPAAAQAPPDTLSEADAVARALAASPALRAAEAAVELARAERSVDSAFLTEGPELDVDAAFDPRELSAPDDYEVGVAVAQTLERPGVRRARRRAAAGRLALSEAERRAAVLSLAADVRGAVTDLAQAQGAHRLSREARVAADSLAEIARLRYEAGDVSELDLRLARADAAVTAAEALGAEADLARAQAALARLLAFPGQASLAVPPLERLPPVPLPADAAALVATPAADTAGVGLRPDVRVADRTVDAAEREAAYRRAGRRFSALTLRAGLKRSALFFGPEDLETGGTPDPLGEDFRLGRVGTDLVVGVAIPLPFGGLGEREATRAEAEVRLREAERDAVVFGARAEATAAATRVRQADLLLEALAPLAEDLAVSDELLGLAQRGGEIDVTTLLTQRERIRSARRALLEARAEARRARLDLARALGRPTAGLPIDPDGR